MKNETAKYKSGDDILSCVRDGQKNIKGALLTSMSIGVRRLVCTMYVALFFNQFHKFQACSMFSCCGRQCTLTDSTVLCFCGGFGSLAVTVYIPTLLCWAGHILFCVFECYFKSANLTYFQQHALAPAIAPAHSHTHS